MTAQSTVRDWARILYYLGQNAISLIGVVLTTSSAVTLIAFWIYDFVLPGSPHPYVGILLFSFFPLYSFWDWFWFSSGFCSTEGPCEPPGNCRRRFQQSTCGCPGCAIPFYLLRLQLY
jgi:hypothetical protein